jgi:hypothetical protein
MTPAGLRYDRMVAQAGTMLGLIVPDALQASLQAGRASTPHEQRNHEQDQKDEEQNLGDSDGRSGDSEEAKGAGNQRDDQKDNCIVKHMDSPR